MYAHLLSSAGVRDADLSFSGEDENASGRDALGTGTPEISGARAERRSSAIGGTPPPRREPTVATVDALRETVPALNRALEDLGYPSPLELLLPDAADLARTCDVLFLLLRDRQEDLAARDAWADERARARADVAAAETRAERLRVSRDAEAAARAADANRRERADDDSRARLERVTAERDAARRELRASTQKLARLEHETRRRELENDRLKARLSAIVESRETRGARDVEKARGGVTLVDKKNYEKGGERGFGSALRDEKKKNGGAGPSPAVSLALHHSMMSAYEAKLRAFMHDANDLRAMLREKNAGVDPETRGAVSGSAAPRPENVSRRSPGPADGAEVPAGTSRRAEDDGLDVEGGLDDEKIHFDDPKKTSARRDATIDDAFAFNLASLRDRLGDEKETEEGRDDDARAAADAAAEAAAPASPLEIALRWHEREHARLSKEALEERSSGSGSPATSERLAWNQKREARQKRDKLAARVGDESARRKTPSSAPPDALLSASPGVSSSEPDEETDSSGGRGGAFGAAREGRGDGSSSEEVFEEVFEEVPPDPPLETKPEPEGLARDTRRAPRREKVAATPRRDAAAGAAPEGIGASAPASPASPLDALLARHLGASRAPAAGPPRDRGEWLERRRRRANPFATDVDDVSVD